MELSTVSLKYSSENKFNAVNSAIRYHEHLYIITYLLNVILRLQK